MQNQETRLWLQMEVSSKKRFAMTINSMLQLAAECGFEHSGELNMRSLRTEPTVRDMCAANRCQSYDRSWSCPPACGTLEEFEKKFSRYRLGILVQTTAPVEDSFDFEAMMAADRLHKERFSRFVSALREQVPELLPLASGTCTVCKNCTYPGAACRFPDRAMSSMEAAGLVVSQICRESGLPYGYGPQTITYTACVLVSLQNSVH